MIEEPADASDRKPEIARAFDEPQNMHVRLRVDAITATRALCRAIRPAVS
jgi:hypothetical protein